MIKLRMVVLVAFATLFGGVGSAVAQDRALLNSVEVKRLVANGDHDGHARLAAHFTALADEHATAARRHRVWSAHPGNPNRSNGVLHTHHLRRARSADEAEGVLRRLAVHHERLAKGMASEAPQGSRRFHEGEGAAQPTAAQIAGLVSAARTPADREVLREYFVSLGERHAQAARRWSAMAAAQSGANRSGAGVAAHYEQQARRSRRLASEAREAAQAQARYLGN